MLQTQQLIVQHLQYFFKNSHQHHPIQLTIHQHNEKYAEKMCIQMQAVSRKNKKYFFLYRVIIQVYFLYFISGKHSQSIFMNLRKNLDFSEDGVSEERSVMSPNSKLTSTKNLPKEEQNFMKNQQENNQSLNYNIVCEDDYFYMLQLFSLCDRPKNLKRQTTILLASLQQFTSKQLLSNDYLWNLPSDINELERYLATIQLLQQKDVQKYVIEKDRQAIIILDKGGQMEYYQGHPIAVQVYQNRNIFMDKLKCRSGVMGVQILTQINRQILFLYKQFFEKKKHIMSMINKLETRNISNISQTTQTYLQQLKKMHESLIDLRQKRIRKKKSIEDNKTRI